MYFVIGIVLRNILECNLYILFFYRLVYMFMYFIKDFIIDVFRLYICIRLIMCLFLR